MRTHQLPAFLLLGLVPLAISGAAEGPAPPAMDLCRYQTAIRDQAARDTCPYFPPVAALEAFYNRMGVKVDLSVEHLIWLRDVACSSDKGDRSTAEDLCNSVGGGNGLGILQKYAICRAEDLPYQGGGEINDMAGAHYSGFGMKDYAWWKPFSQLALNRWNFDPRQSPPAARVNARYAIERFATFPEEDLRDPRKFEEVLASGHEIIFAINLHGQGDGSARGEPVWRVKPGAPFGGSHFMLMVGYDRARRFFVVKNQWGPTDYSSRATTLASGWKDIVKYDGYTLIDYDYLEQCTEAHYITAAAPPEGPRLRAQRALGQWQVTFSRGKEPLARGVLVWRNMPTTDGPKPDRRIGDLLTEDGQQYRVNARFEGDDARAGKLTLFIDFRSGYIPVDSTGGSAWSGDLNLTNEGGGTLALEHVGQGMPGPNGSSEAGDRLAAKLVPDRNLLAEMTSPSKKKAKPSKNLLVNGSFEEGPEVDAFLPLDEGSMEIRGWKVTRGQIDYLDAHWKAAEGLRSLDLHGSPGYGGVEQTFRTTRKHRYRVTFDLAGSPGCDFFYKSVIVTAAGQSHTFAFDATGKTHEEMGWLTKEWEFEAVDDHTTLEIRTGEEGRDPVAGPALDDVRVEAIPTGAR